jgi:putative IMPACT (imprinted ancient) family translation regulator
VREDNDDDGETAAGGRLAHLLQILVLNVLSCICSCNSHISLKEVSNCLVVVTRYFGGIHLGPDRFKHINQVARNAMEKGGFLDEHEAKGNNGKTRKR